MIRATEGQTAVSDSRHQRWDILFVMVVLVLPLFSLYLATARTSLPYHNDALTNVITAWNLGEKSTPILDEHQPLVEYRQYIGWVTDSPRGPVSQYPPGTALLAAPLYVIVDDAPIVELHNGNAETLGLEPVDVPLPALWPAAIVAAGTTAAAIGFLALSVLALGMSRLTAIGAGYVTGLGTGAWSVASDSLWQHGPGMMWITLASWLVARESWLSAGIAYSLVVLTRPPVVLVGIAVGVWLVMTKRWRPAMRLFAGSAPGVVALLAYNWWLFGRLTISGAYGEGFTANALDPDPTGLLANLWEAAANPRYGLFIFTPIILILLLASARAAAREHAWPVIAAVGGLAVLLLQLKANRASGGGDFLYYRYPLEPVAAAAPFLTIAWIELWKVSIGTRLVMAVATAWSIGIHAYAVWLFR